jgi:hypothetical protein
VVRFGLNAVALVKPLVQATVALALFALVVARAVNAFT